MRCRSICRKFIKATLKVKISEQLIINNQDYGSENILEISGINEIVKRTVKLTTTETGLIGFASFNSRDLLKSYLAGVFAEEEVKYIRITNLDDGNHISLTFRNESNDEFLVVVDYGHSFFYPCDNSGGVVDTMDAENDPISTKTLADLVDITAIANTSSCNVEVFVGSA